MSSYSYNIKTITESERGYPIRVDYIVGFNVTEWEDGVRTDRFVRPNELPAILDKIDERAREVRGRIMREQAQQLMARQKKLDDERRNLEESLHKLGREYVTVMYGL